MSLEDLYKAKGKLTTEIEIAQAKLAHVNKEIIEIINKAKTLDTRENLETKNVEQ